MRYIFKVNGQPSRDSFPTREAATAAAFCLLARHGRELW